MYTEYQDADENMDEIEQKDHAGHRARLKKQFIENGPEQFYHHQLLELLLFYAIPLKDTNPLAHRLIERFGDIERVMTAPAESLMSVDGMGKNAAAFLKAVEDIYAEYGRADSGGRIFLDNGFSSDSYYSSVFAETEGEQLGMTTLDEDGSATTTQRIYMAEGPKAAERKLCEAIAACECKKCVLCVYRPSGVPLSYEERVAYAKIRDMAGRLAEIAGFYVLSGGKTTVFSEPEYK